MSKTSVTKIVKPAAKKAAPKACKAAAPKKAAAKPAEKKVTAKAEKKVAEKAAPKAAKTTAKAPAKKSTKVSAPKAIVKEIVADCPLATTVSVAGTFNNWMVDVDMMKKEKKTGLWKIKLELLPGDYEYKCVCDGINWDMGDNKIIHV